ncbi:MAG: hypothetical protein NTY67_03840 [Cyanobacteria bacterium]|nr:hypothetical protein [Cyanobacteriota bacterium]
MASADRPVIPAQLRMPELWRGPSVGLYRGFVLIPQADLGWLIRPERKALLNWRLTSSQIT